MRARSALGARESGLQLARLELAVQEVPEEHLLEGPPPEADPNKPRRKENAAITQPFSSFAAIGRMSLPLQRRGTLLYRNCGNFAAPGAGIGVGSGAGRGTGGGSRCVSPPIPVFCAAQAQSGP